METSRKVFNLEEANALLPQLESLLAELEIKREAFCELQDSLFFQELLEEISPPEGRIQEMEDTLMKLEGEITKIRELGCVLRHSERGLVDFLARRGEDLVYYCWRRGEREIQFFHTLSGGFFERKPLD